MKSKLLKVTLALMATAWVGGVQAQDTPNFGSEEVVSEETTWVFNDYSIGDLAAWDNTNSTYPVTNKLYARRYSSRKFTISALVAPETVSFSDGYTISVSKIASSSSSNTTYTDITTANSTGGNYNESNGYANMTAYFAFNASVAGTCYVLLKETGTANDGFRGRIYFWNGTEVTSPVSQNVPKGTTAGSLYEIKYDADGGSYFIGATGNSFSIYAIRFVPTATKADKIVYIGATGYATYGSVDDTSYTLPDGLKAYGAQASADNHSVELTESTTGIKKSNAYILKGAPYTNYRLTKNIGTTADPTNSTLERAKEDVTFTVDDKGFDSNTSKYNYILAADGGVAKFFAVANGSTLAKGKAYLQTDAQLTPRAGAGSRGVSIIFADEATGIEAVTTQQGDGLWYNLQGQKVAQPAKGLFIKNGKKVIIK